MQLEKGDWLWKHWQKNQIQTDNGAAVYFGNLPDRTQSGFCPKIDWINSVVMIFTLIYNALTLWMCMLYVLLDAFVYIREGRKNSSEMLSWVCTWI